MGQAGGSNGHAIKNAASLLERNVVIAAEVKTTRELDAGRHKGSTESKLPQVEVKEVKQAA